ncbi:MAG TPA: hypothetical protein DHW82_02585 [Spirochaetia bacterium]|nr:MAG: hypothetical protein A2Y41_10455 [Spirochaetes bacterium GWB1_36_13]HCL55878.1 hypothetical protein [Spirochaetia bacterium]
MKKILFSLLVLAFFTVSCGGEGTKKDADLGKQRKQTIASLDKEVSEGITQLEKDIKDAIQWNLKQVKADTEKNKNVGDEATLKVELMKKIRPVQKIQDEAKALYEESKEIAKSIESKLDESDLPEFDKYKENMTTASGKIKEASANLKAASDEFQKDFKKLGN